MTSVWHDIALSLWFFLPAANANVAPIFASKIPGFSKWNTPIDNGATFRGKQLLGPHKTWRGFISGILLATLTLWLQQLAVHHFGWAQTVTREVNYASFPTLLMGPLFGLGALGGDAIKSFFKRQRGTPSGQTWIPFDQLDYIIGGVLVSLPFVRLKLVDYLWVFIIWFGLHLVSSYIGWLVGLKERPI